MAAQAQSSGGKRPSPPAPEEGPKPLKAYKNSDFLNSHNARLIRVMCELQEPGQRLDNSGVDNIVMFFGSARAKPKDQYEAALAEAKAAVVAKPDDVAAKAALARIEKQAFLVPMAEITRELARRFSEWSLARAKEGRENYVVGTGAGPGMMEVANRGAWEANAPSVGFGISLPFEDRLNPYVTPELGFEFHYFFTRKFWMCYKCVGLVVAPGGLGTCDELFELMTLMQTGKIKRKLPIILIGKKFWQACIKWEAFVEYGMISESDASQLIFVDTADEAFEALTSNILKLETQEQQDPPSSKKLRSQRTGG